MFAGWRALTNESSLMSACGCNQGCEPDSICKTNQKTPIAPQSHNAAAPCCNSTWLVSIFFAADFHFLTRSKSPLPRPMDVGKFLIFRILLRPSQKQLDAPRRDTIAEVLRNADYFTTLSGKRHLSKSPTDFGFQTHCFAV